ncbi:MAG: hypothetical protein IJ682_08600 [Lachnospiraceae bacterium]|nr:hypothetical protein [Lachnospiraceae bacterium]
MKWKLPFGKRKRKKQEELDASFGKVMEEIQRIDDWDNPKRLQHYILDSCEQIVGRTKVVEKQKAEYRVLTNYLNDIRRLGSLNQKQSKQLKNVAKRLTETGKAREDYANVTHRLHEEQYVLLDANEEFLPGEIRQMQANETYQYKMKRDIRLLEATKSECEIERERNTRFRNLMRKIAIMLLACCASLVLLFMLLQFSLGIDMTLASMLLLLVMVLFVLYLFFRNSQISRENRQAITRLNRTISLLNVARMKYANVTGAINFVQKKYSVRTSYELNYLWDAYMEERRIREKNRQDNEDYRYMYRKLVKFLNSLELFDSDIWIEQTAALMSEDEMQKVKSNLVERRQQLREQIEENTRMIQDERDEVSRLMRDHDYYPPEIVEIISSVDRMCGLNINYHFR